MLIWSGASGARIWPEAATQISRNLLLGIGFVIGFSTLTHLVLAGAVNRPLDPDPPHRTRADLSARADPGA